MEVTCIFHCSTPLYNHPPPKNQRRIEIMAQHDIKLFTLRKTMAVSGFYTVTGWWFQTVSKILVKLEIFPKSGWKNTY